jgi:DNA-binding transcriptional LysR family regulator
MNLRQLRYFCEIVESGSAVAAAGRLHVAPTALSMQLARLEEELGGRIQVGVSRYLGRVEPVEGLVFTHLFDDPFVVALPAKHALAGRKSLRPTDLDQADFITYPKDPQSRFAEHTIALLRAAGNRSPMAYEAIDIHTALGMVASHLGFCLVGRSVEPGSRRDLAFVPMARLEDKAAVFAVVKAGEQSSRAGLSRRLSTRSCRQIGRDGA